MGEKTAQERIHDYLKFGSKLGLERMESLLALIGNPEKDIRVIHVAGTNGKGSVCRYLYETLRALGYTAGIFTSPYVGDFRERIETNGEMIPEEKLEALTDIVISAAEKLAEAGDFPTEFEVVTAIGLKYFAETNPDFVILEVGLGGRGDSTNVIDQPLVSIITQISLDHMEQLGDAVEKIAWEKAGIIKKGCPVISGATGPAQAVIARCAYETGAPFYDSSKIKYWITDRSIEGYTFSAVIDGRRYDHIELSMSGEHQVRNAVTALYAIEILRAKKLICLDGEALRLGMKSARLEARIHVVSADPLIIFDGAHNADGARALTKALGELLPSKKILFVVSILRDKAIAEMLEEFVSVASGFIATSSSNDRSLDSSEMAEMIEDAGGRVMAKTDFPKEAYNKALRHAGEYDAVVFAGSLYMISDIIRGIESESR